MFPYVFSRQNNELDDPAALAETCAHWMLLDLNFQQHSLSMCCFLAADHPLLDLGAAF